jgi:SAM-dependent methyltransferase
MKVRDTFLHGDAVEQLRRLDEGSVHFIMTSPPYWKQRDYGVESQIGWEDTVDEYIENLVDVFRECYRVLREDGSFVLNVGDAYVNKERQLIPFRLAERLREDVGFVVRQDLVWEKEHGKPDPANDRRANIHEYLFHLTKGRNYWYDESVRDGDHTSVIEAPTATSDLDHVAVYSEELVEEAARGLTPPKVCSQCGTPYERTYDETPRPFADPERPQAKRAYELYEESHLSEEHIEAVQSVGISDVGKATRTEDGAGRNTDEVIELANEAKDVLGGYYREFTMVERVPSGWKQSCSCDAGDDSGVVLDPFVGSGTTAVVAERYGYHYVGIDVNGDYLDTARQRVGGIEA